jgi:hypothetical protein
VVTFGVSAERGTVHAVALSDDEGKLPDRVVSRRTFRVGDSKADLVRAIEAALEALADEIGPDREIAGAAVAYRDPAERRAVVTGLAKGPWHTASLVSAKSAHLAVARAMPWTGEFDHLLVCEVVPGHQSFSLISPERDRVVAAIAATGSAVSEATMRPAVTAAWDQFDAAGVQPEAVVLMGSAATHPAVAAALTNGFAVPIIPSRVAKVGAAVGAALAIAPEAADIFAAVERTRLSRGAAALVAAASVLAGGVAAGGIYEATTGTRPASAPVLADARAAANSHQVPEAERLAPESEAQDEAGVPVRSPAATKRASHRDSAGSPNVVSVGPVGMSWGPGAGRRMGLQPDSGDEQQLMPSVTPVAPSGSASASAALDSTVRVQPPDQRLLFKGEAAPPRVGSPEFNHWWNNHWRMMAEWASGMMPRI